MRNYHYRLRMAGLWVVATMPLVFGGAFAQSEAKKPVSQVEQSYQAGAGFKARVANRGE